MIEQVLHLLQPSYIHGYNWLQDQPNVYCRKFSILSMPNSTMLFIIVIECVSSWKTIMGKREETAFKAVGITFYHNSTEQIIFHFACLFVFSYKIFSKCLSYLNVYLCVGKNWLFLQAEAISCGFGLQICQMCVGICCTVSLSMKHN